MVPFQQYVTSPWLTPVRLVCEYSLTGTYYNGPLNNGVGAQLITPIGIVSMDYVGVNFGDRVLLANQNSQNQNGVYVCTQAGTDSTPGIFERAADLQCLEQMHTGFYVSVGAGYAYSATFWTLVEPIPAHVGVSPLIFKQDVPQFPPPPPPPTITGYNVTIGDGTNNFETSFTQAEYFTINGVTWAWGYIQWSSQGTASPTDHVRVSLPFSCNGVFGRPTVTFGDLLGFNFSNQLVGSVDGIKSYFDIFDLNKTGGTAYQLQCGDLEAVGEIQFSLSFSGQFSS